MLQKLKKESKSCSYRCRKLAYLDAKNLKMLYQIIFHLQSIDNVNISSKGFNTDIHASAEYRAHIIKVMAKKAVSSC